MDRMEWCSIKTLRPLLGRRGGPLVNSTGSRWYARGPDESFVLRAMVVIGKPRLNFPLQHISLPAPFPEA